MARSFRSRRYAPRLRRRYRVKKSSLSKIKKDILKCNFPTKVKFMGLTEKKTMFLTHSFDANINGNGFNFYLSPLNSENIGTIYTQNHPYTVGVDADGRPITRNGRIANWDKLCILGVYIKFQPKKNVWVASANAGPNINTVECTYTMNNLDPNPPANDSLLAIDFGNKINKQLFTFNSNEAFTIYVPAPTTMELSSACVHRSKTWWSLTDLVPFANGGHTLEREDDSDEEVSDEGVDELGNVMGNGLNMHAGRIYLRSTGGAEYNITINYKVALKG